MIWIWLDSGKRTALALQPSHEGNHHCQIAKAWIRGETAQIFMTDIFGKTAGSERVHGLIDEASSGTPDSAMENLKAKWTSQLRSEGSQHIF